jgi:uncharacterized membrane protein (UPF0127 family)
MIKNSSKKTELASKKKYAKTLWQRARGLMFTFPQNDSGLIFVFPKLTEASLHMFFVFYPIDILWLDEKKKVVDLRTRIMPFMPLIVPKKKAKYVIELPIFSIENSKTKIGDKIEF